MTVYFLIPFFSALVCAALAFFALVTGRRSFVHCVFAAGMIAFAVEEALLAMSVVSTLPSEVMQWQRARLFASTFLPTAWLLFSLSFGRAGYKEFVKQWQWIALSLLAFPVLLQVFFGASVFTNVFQLNSSRWVLRLGWAGQLVYLCFFLSAVFVLVNLERTLRASTGIIRWRIKFTVLGLGGLFAAQIYTNSQALLVSSVDTAVEQINSAAIIVANLLIGFSLARSRLLNTDVYLSQQFLYNSITVLIVGIYLVAVGVFVKVISRFGGDVGVTIPTFFFFLALLGLGVVLLSEQLRQQLRRFVNRHFKRPQYDYRKEWMNFTQRTTSLVDIKHLCAAAAGMVSDTFGVPGVTIWLWQEADGRLVLGGSTVISSDQARSLESSQEDARALFRVMRDQHMPVDFDEAENGWAGTLKRLHGDYFRQLQMRYCATLIAGQQAVGLMTLSDRLTKVPFSLEDLDLLKTIADQTASSVLNAKLSQQLLRAKEMEAFQTISAFFVHDLKNLASALSLTLDNFRTYSDDPDFRRDALQTIAESVDRINSMCRRLALAAKKPELKFRRTDLNNLLVSTLSTLDGSLNASLTQELKPLPQLLLDREQIQKVLINLLLNANEAVGANGKIEIATAQQNGWVVFSVSDNGCGMSREFVARSLFQPFQTTKKRGLGIGLFHCKWIVEAHGGTIEVESKEGNGSTFSIKLPAAGNLRRNGAPEVAGRLT